MTGGGEAPSESIDSRVADGLAVRLLAPQLTAHYAHLVALAALVALFSGLVPSGPLWTWAVAVLLAIGHRAAVTGWARRRNPGFQRMRQRIRESLAGAGLAWGLGAAVLLRYLPTAYVVLILAVFAAFVAGGATTLVSDTFGFRLFSLCLLIPLALGMLLLSRDRLYLVSAFLILSFAVFMSVMNAEAHRALVDHLRTSAALQDALANVKTLSGLLPICASCKKIRDDQGYWSQIEVFVREHSDAEFSHSLCPDCIHRLYPELSEAPESQSS